MLQCLFKMSFQDNNDGNVEIPDIYGVIIIDDRRLLILTLYFNATVCKLPKRNVV